MTDIQIFKNADFGEVRTLTIGNGPYFVGKDVASILGYAKPENAIANHVDDEDKTSTLIQGSGSNYKSKTIVINESGLYSLILSSKLPNARKFKRWVTNEVLPSIRENGAYMTTETLEQALTSPDFLIELAQKLKEEKQKRVILQNQNALLECKVTAYEPKIKYVDEILQSKDTVTATQIAADYGISANKLNKILNEQKIQRKVGGQWVLYKEHMGKGYTKSETINIKHSDGRKSTAMQTKWTQKGRPMIHNILSSQGIRANIDKHI